MRAIAAVAIAVLLGGTAIAAPLRIGIGPLPPAIGNPYTGVGLPPGDLWANIFDGLTRLDDAGHLQPALALSWTAETPTRWVFKLRPGVRFHDGTPFSAADVAATIALLRGPAAGTIVATEVRGITDVKVLDDLKIAFTTATPDATLPNRFNLIAIQSASRLEESGWETMVRSPVGTGPYAVTATTPATVSLAARGSWRTAKTERIEVQAIPNPTARVQALLSKQVDLIQSVSPDALGQLREQGFKVVVTPQAQVLSVALPNMALGPLQDARVRRALNLAIDRHAIADGIFAGTVSPANQGATPGVNGYNETLPELAFDPAAARRLLAEAGYADGFELSIFLVEGTGGDTQVAFEQVSQYLIRIGVRVRLQLVPIGVFTRRYATAAWNSGEAFSMLWNSAPIGDVARPLETFSCLRPNPFFCDEPTAKLIAASASDLDPARRTRELRAIMGNLRDIAPAIWITSNSVITAMRPEIQGFHQQPAGSAWENLTVAP